jgi:hypothetical protein
MSKKKKLLVVGEPNVAEDIKESLIINKIKGIEVFARVEQKKFREIMMLIFYTYPE